MALPEIQPNAVSQIYARSLFELAESKGGRELVESVLNELETVRDLAREIPEYGEFMASPSLGASERATSLDKILRGRVSELTLNFLQVLNDRDRLRMFRAVLASLDAMVQERYGRVEVDIYTAQELTPAEVASICARLEQKLAKPVVPHTHVEPAMLGGVKFRIGDQLLDASLSSQIRELKEQIQVQGMSKLRAKMDSAMGG